MTYVERAMRGKIITLVQTVLRSESGATAIEYGLIASLVFLVIVGAVNSLASSVQTKLYNVMLAL